MRSPRLALSVHEPMMVRTICAAVGILPLLVAADVPVTSLDQLDLKQVKAQVLTFKGKKALRMEDAAPPTAGDDGRLAVLKGSSFENGVIELYLAGEPAAGSFEGARGFVGIAFRLQPGASGFECFYLRPTNGRADDQERRNHSAQYISAPDWPWNRLRRQFPMKYETYVDLVPAEWTKVKIEVHGTRAALYVHDAGQPTLIVNDLKHGQRKGAIALWIGPGTVAHFADLRVTD